MKDIAALSTGRLCLLIAMMHVIAKSVLEHCLCMEWPDGIGRGGFSLQISNVSLFH